MTRLRYQPITIILPRRKQIAAILTNPPSTVALFGAMTTMFKMSASPAGVVALTSAATMQSNRRSLLRGAAELSGSFVSAFHGNTGTPTLLAAISARFASMAKGTSTASGVVPLNATLHTQLTTSTAISAGVNLQALAGRFASIFTGRATVSGAAPLSGQMRNMLTLTGAPEGQAAMSGRLTTQAKANPTLSGTVPLMARLTTAFTATPGIGGKVALAGKMAARLTAQAGITGISNLVALAGRMGVQFTAQGALARAGLAGSQVIKGMIIDLRNMMGR